MEFLMSLPLECLFGCPICMNIVLGCSLFTICFLMKKACKLSQCHIVAICVISLMVDLFPKHFIGKVCSFLFTEKGNSEAAFMSSSSSSKVPLS